MAGHSVSKDSGYDGSSFEQLVNAVKALPTRDKATLEAQLPKIPTNETEEWPKPDEAFNPRYSDPCKEIDLEQRIFVSWLLDSTLLDKDKTTLHVEDLISTWLGVSEDQSGPLPQLCIYPQLERLVNSAVNAPLRQYPSLISFVGDTNAGKSTLIRAMIEALAPCQEYQVPVQGSESDRYLSTSSDIHLFADPKTQSSEVPRFFIDCEGFHGTDQQAHEILATMFDWAKDGHDRTLNQRVRPGLIIVLNKTRMATHKSPSSAEKDTNDLLRSFEDSKRFQELQHKWKVRGRDIETAGELIQCYYEDFRVLTIDDFIPNSPAIVESIFDQIKTLYGEIVSMSERIRGQRKSCNLDLDTSSLSAYLNRSAVALGKDCQNSLDFHQLSDGDMAPPRRFSEHLAQLMARMAKMRHFDTTDEVNGETKMILEMTPYIAACIVAQINPNLDQKQQQKRKDDLVHEARRGLEQFRDCSWRCEEQDHHGQRRCKNYFESHRKGHQFDLMDDPSPAPGASVENMFVGGHKCSFNPAEFIDNLWEELSKINPRASPTKKLASCADKCGIKDVTTQRTCLACLSNTPTNMLPCKPKQHGICEECIKRYNPGVGEVSTIRINACPLGCLFTTTPWTIRVKPETAGARILALDGGGVRGIVELVILAEIEKTVGFGIRLQDLFDLVIGTSTGGLVALGVFEKKWPLGDAIEQFCSLAKKAFLPRKLLTIPGLSKVTKPWCSFKYKSAGVNTALTSAFGEDYLFGQTTDDKEPGDQVKVGVVTCLDGQKHPCLLANYSRNPIEKLKDGTEAYDCLQRADVQDEDFPTWAAARATSAAQTLFKPYIHEASRRTYVDGATVRNNPVGLAHEESRRIWKSATPPDIVLSIGTGIWVDENWNYVDKTPTRLAKFIPSGIRKKVETGIEMVYATLDCDREWVDFSVSPRSNMGRNCHRLNVALFEKPAALDDVGELTNLRETSKIHLESDKGLKSDYIQDQKLSPKQHIVIVAQRLVSSLFYLSTSLSQTTPGGPTRTTLHCRLPSGSNGAGALVSEFRQPSFRMREVSEAGETIVRPIQFLSGNSFNHSTMSVEVQLEVTQGLYQ
ncbi:calcium-independent phospholipase A2, partial [Fusarium phyllophilum]